VRSGEFATDIPRAMLNKNKYLKITEFSISTALRATNQEVGSSNLSGRTTHIEVIENKVKKLAETACAGSV
jgi:hypothetical protein